jgi:hypothetical protein
MDLSQIRFAPLQPQWAVLTCFLAAEGPWPQSDAFERLAPCFHGLEGSIVHLVSTEDRGFTCLTSSHFGDGFSSSSRQGAPASLPANCSITNPVASQVSLSRMPCHGRWRRSDAASGSRCWHTFCLIRGNPAPLKGTCDCPELDHRASGRERRGWRKPLFQPSRR